VSDEAVVPSDGYLFENAFLDDGGGEWFARDD